MNETIRSDSRPRWTPSSPRCGRASATSTAMSARTCSRASRPTWLISSPSEVPRRSATRRVRRRAARRGRAAGRGARVRAREADGGACRAVLDGARTRWVELVGGLPGSPWGLIQSLRAVWWVARAWLALQTVDLFFGSGASNLGLSPVPSLLGVGVCRCSWSRSSSASRWVAGGGGPGRPAVVSRPGCSCSSSTPLQWRWSRPPRPRC